MAWEAWLTLGTVVAAVVAMAMNLLTAELCMLGALAALLLVGAATESTLLPTAAVAMEGFGNPVVIAIGALFVVVCGLSNTGAVAAIGNRLLGRPRTLRGAQGRLLFPVMALSAFMNNTPVVAMFMPVVQDLCRRTGIEPSKLFMPLAFVATFGGVCTLIGTSTNLLVSGLLIEAELAPLGLFEIGLVGLPCALVGMAYILTCSNWLLPERRSVIRLDEDPRSYTIEMTVVENGPLVGRTVEAAGLRHLPGLYLLEIERHGEVIAAVGPQQRLAGGDRLVFVGVVESVVDLRRVRGLAPASGQQFKLTGERDDRCLIEAVVSHRCPLVGRSIREGAFRTVYDAAVIAVARGGERLYGKIGDIVLQSGDTLLLETDRRFARQQQNRNDFYLVSAVEGSSPPRHDKAWIALLLLAAMVGLVAGGMLELSTAALAAALGMLALGCCSAAEAWAAVEWRLLVTVAAAIGLGSVLESTGVASAAAEQIFHLAGDHPWLALAGLYLVTLLLTEAVSNNAAAAIVFPVALAAATQLQVNPMPFVIAVAVAASAGFATPMGYQTHLMVYGPGGYRFNDYLKFGIPLDLLFMLVTVGLAPLIWPFR